MKKHYLTDFGNVKMKDFLLRNGDVKEDNNGVYVTDLIEHQELQEQFDVLEYFKTIENFVNAFELEYFITQGDYEYYARVVEDDNNINSLLCELLKNENSVIKIGDKTSIEEARITSFEPYKIEIGKDCMFSANIVIMNTDVHKIYDTTTKLKTNEGKEISIGNHVWLGIRAIILKGVSIGDNSIVAAGSIVTKDVKANTVVSGNPARQVKENRNWSRDL